MRIIARLGNVVDHPMLDEGLVLDALGVYRDSIRGLPDVTLANSVQDYVVGDVPRDRGEVFR